QDLTPADLRDRCKLLTHDVRRNSSCGGWPWIPSGGRVGTGNRLGESLAPPHAGRARDPVGRASLRASRHRRGARTEPRLSGSLASRYPATAPDGQGRRNSCGDGAVSAPPRSLVVILAARPTSSRLLAIGPASSWGAVGRPRPG